MGTGRGGAAAVVVDGVQMSPRFLKRDRRRIGSSYDGRSSGNGMKVSYYTIDCVPMSRVGKSGSSSYTAVDLG